MASKYKGPKLSELKGSALHRRIQQLAANPATRSQVPAQYLTGNLAHLARSRALNARLNAPVVPGDTMTNRDLAREANAATNVQYGPQERAQAQQGQQLQLQGRNTGDYYTAYINALKASQDHAAAISGAVSQRLQDIGSSGQQAATSADTSTLQKMREDAQARGASFGPQLAQQASNATQVNRGLSDASAGTASLLGQGQANYLQALQAAAGQGRLQALGANQLAQSNLGQSRADLAREKGQANLAYRGKRRSEEATNVATSALAGVKVDTAKTASAQKGLDFLAKTGHTPTYAATHPGKFAQDVVKRQKQLHPSKAAQDAPFKYGYTKKEWLALPLDQRKKIDASHAKKGKAGATPDATSGPGSLNKGDETKRVSQVNRAAQYLHDGKIPDKDPKSGAVIYRKAKNRGEVIAWLKAHGIDPDVLGVADSLAANNLQGLGPKGVEHAHNAGLHVGGRWKVVTAPAVAKRTRG